MTVVTVIISCCLGVIIFRDTLGAMTMADIKNDFSWEIAGLAMLTDIRDDSLMEFLKDGDAAVRAFRLSFCNHRFGN